MSARPGSRTADARIVVTGFGAVSAWGWDAASLWRGLGSDRTGIAPARCFDTRGQRTEIAGEVPADDADRGAAFPEWGRYSQADRFGVVAAAEAWRRAELSPAAPDPRPELGVFFGGSTAGMAECEEVFDTFQSDAAHSRWSRLASHQLNCPGDAVARCFGAGGPVQSLSSACASGGLAIGAALDALRAGEVEISLAGGADSLCRLTYSGFNALRAVDPQPCRPFRGGRAGMSLGEGAGMLVLETLERARRRGVRPCAELLGAGASCDAHHMTAPHPEGEGAALAVERALHDAGIGAEDVDFINAHGTGTPHNDESESRAIRRVFGERASRLPLTSTKASVGHLLGSSGALEAVVTVQCLLAREVHAVPGGGEVDPACEVDLVQGAPRPLPGGAQCVAISTSFGFGGANAALVLASWPQEHTF